MEVHGRQPADRYRESREQLARANRERVREAREFLADMAAERGEELRRARETELAETQRRADARRTEEARERQDVLELSVASRLEGTDEERAQRVQELKSQYQAGTLDSPERIEKAAEGLLGR